MATTVSRSSSKVEHPFTYASRTFLRTSCLSSMVRKLRNVATLCGGGGIRGVQGWWKQCW